MLAEASSCLWKALPESPCPAGSWLVVLSQDGKGSHQAVREVAQPWLMVLCSHHRISVLSLKSLSFLSLLPYTHEILCKT